MSFEVSQPRRMLCANFPDRPGSRRWYPRLASAILGAFALVTGCVQPPVPEAPSEPPADVALAGSQFDGTYTGRLSVSLDRGGVSGVNPCSGDPAAVMTVANGVATMRVKGQTFVDPVAGDGRFPAKPSGRGFRGRIQGDQVTGTSDSIACGYSFELRRR